MAFLEKFSHNVREENGCWIWTASLNNRGYGVAYHASGQHLAHRLAFTMDKGPIKDGLEIDHLCRTPACCNPSHLEAVTHSENMLRAPLKRDHCRNGHAFAGNEATVGGRRTCLTCRATGYRRRLEKCAAARAQPKCRRCAVEFIRTERQQRFCGTECRRLHRNERRWKGDK